MSQLRGITSLLANRKTGSIQLLGKSLGVCHLSQSEWRRAASATGEIDLRADAPQRGAAGVSQTRGIPSFGGPDDVVAAFRESICHKICDLVRNEAEAELACIDHIRSAVVWGLGDRVAIGERQCDVDRERASHQDGAGRFGGGFRYAHLTVLMRRDA